MGQLTKKKSLSVGDILNKVNSEKTYFVYTDKGVRIIKYVAFLLLVLFIGNQYFQRTESLKLQPVANVTGKQVFGDALKDVNIIDLEAVAPLMKNKQKMDLKIRGKVSKVSPDGKFEMILDNGKILSVNYKTTAGVPSDFLPESALLSKEVVMAGKISKIENTQDLAFEASSLVIL